MLRKDNTNEWHLDNTFYGICQIAADLNGFSNISLHTWTTNDTTYYVDAVIFSWLGHFTKLTNFMDGNVTVDGGTTCTLVLKGSGQGTNEFSQLHFYNKDGSNDGPQVAGKISTTGNSAGVDSHLNFYVANSKIKKFYFLFFSFFVFLFFSFFFFFFKFYTNLLLNLQILIVSHGSLSPQFLSKT